MICYGPLRATDTIVCFRGHAVCRSCWKKKSTFCALCRASYSKNKPTLLCQMLEALPQFCRYEGCDKVIRENDNHEALCMFRIVSCNVCGLTVKFKRFLYHLSDAHNSFPCGMDVAADLLNKKFYCDRWFHLKLGMSKLFRNKLNRNIFNVTYFFKNSKLQVHITYLPIGNVHNSTYSIKLEMWSADKKVNVIFCRKVNMKPNKVSLVFNVAENILKSFDGRNCYFKTTIWQ
jgi:hypothetical protein